MKITISDTLFKQIVTAEKRKEISWLLEMTKTNSWWSTQVGMKHLAQYCPSYLRVIGIILNNIPLAILAMAVYFFFTKEFAFGAFSLLVIIPLLYIVPKSACRVVRIFARRNKMFFVELYASGVLHIYSMKKKEGFSYPRLLEDAL
jgi:hypothetical protein